MISVALDHATQLFAWYAVAYEWIVDHPHQMVIYVMASVILVWLVLLAIHIRRYEQRQRLRGSKMSRNARKRWLQRHAADTIYAAFEKELDAGHISQAEFTALIRMAKSRVGLPDLASRKRWGVVEVTCPSKNTVKPDHLKIVKAAILGRLNNWKFRNLLYKPVSIPGPPVGAEVKSKILKKRGALFGKVKSA